MCQLTLVKTTNEDLNKLLLSILLPINTATHHVEGTGMANFTEKKPIIRKTKLQADAISNYSEYFLPAMVGTEAIFGHVRRVTYKTTVEDEYAHPFYDEKSKITLAHNGTLSFIDWKRRENVDNEFPKMIDTQIFLAELSKIYLDKKNIKTYKNIEEALIKTMEAFAGKFAFLIHEGETNKIYVVRGKTATLFETEVRIGEKLIGKVINTEKLTFDRGLYLAGTVWNSLYPDKKVEFSTPTALPVESINELVGYDLIVRKSIKEEQYVYENPNKKKNKTEYTVWVNGEKQTRYYGGNNTTPEKDTISKPVHHGATKYEESLEQISKLADELWLDGDELDIISEILYGVPLACMDIDILPDFIEYLTILNEQVYAKELLTEKKKTIWQSILNKTYSFPKHLYCSKETLKFPFFMNSVKALEKINVELDEEDEYAL